MRTVSDKLSTWLAEQLNIRAWSARELARRIGMSQTSISRYLEGTLTPSPKTCHKLAAALGADLRKVMQLAGHLPSPLPTVEGEEEAITILRSLSTDTRTIVMQILRSLDHRPARALAEPPPQYEIQALDQDIAKIIEDYPDLESILAEARNLLEEHALRALIFNIKVWIQEEEAQARHNFANLHKKLSKFLIAN